MKVSRLKEILSQFDDDVSITFYFQKNDILTNCQVHDIELYDPDMGLEFTIQDTIECDNESIVH